jgi:hypothetical protein
VGFPPNQAGWLIHVPYTNEFYVSQDVAFDEDFQSTLAFDVVPFHGAAPIRHGRNLSNPSYDVAITGPVPVSNFQNFHEIDDNIPDGVFELLSDRSIEEGEDEQSDFAFPSPDTSFLVHVPPESESDLINISHEYTEDHDELNPDLVTIKPERPQNQTGIEHEDEEDYSDMPGLISRSDNVFPYLEDEEDDFVGPRHFPKHSQDPYHSLPPPRQSSRLQEKRGDSQS